MKWALPATAPLLLAACVADIVHPTIDGSLGVRRGDGSEVHWIPDRCRSGDVEYFAGFDFLSSHDRGHLRALLDPVNGPVLRWSGDDGAQQKPLILRAADCTLLELDIQPTMWRVNDVREFAGHVDLSCNAADGTHLEGRLAVDHCH